MTSSKIAIAPPLPLFDPATGELPPRDAIEVYLEPPPSLSLLHVGVVATGQHPELLSHLEAAWAAGQAAALDALLRNLYLKVGHHYDRPGQPSVGSYLPGRLSITHVPHLCVPGEEPYAQMHDHLYIAPTAMPDEARCMSMAGTPLLSRCDAGKPWPLDVGSLRGGTGSLLDALYQTAIQQELTDRIGTVWIPGHRGAPPVAAQCQGLVEDFPRIMCAGLPRARPERPATKEQLLVEALAAEPDAMEERQQEICREVDRKLLRARQVERLVIRDIVDPPPPDHDLY